MESRLPLQRRGLSHISSNCFNNVLSSGINVRMGALALIETNHFENAKNLATSRDSSKHSVGSGITWSVADSTGKS